MEVLTKDEHLILSSMLGLKPQAHLLEKKLTEMNKKLSELLKNWMRFMFVLLKDCFSPPKLLQFLKRSTCLNQPALFEMYDKPYAYRSL